MSGERRKIADALRDSETARQLMRVALDSQERTIATLRSALQTSVEAGVKSLPDCSVAATEHRKAHRYGRPPILDTNPELRAFVLARIDALTFQQIAAEVSAQFPPAHRVGKSTIQRWWQLNHKSSHRP